MLEHGADEERRIEQAERAGVPIPDVILNKPELYVGLQLYLDAFFELDSERNHGQGVMAIPLSRVRDYANAHEFDEEQTADLIYFIRIMDTDHLKRLTEKHKAAVEAAAKRKG